MTNSSSLDIQMPQNIERTSTSNDRQSLSIRAAEKSPMTHSVSTQENGVSSSSSPERNMEDDIQLQTFKADQGLEDGQIHPESIRDQSQSNLPSRASTLNTSLPPVDGGVQAWIFVASAFVIEFCAWGFGFSFGVFQSHYTSSESPFMTSLGPPSPAIISIIGTFGIAFPHCLPVLFSKLFASRPYWVKPLMILGLSLACISLFAASFCKSVGPLLLTQGIGFGIGSGLFFAPVMLWLPEWFFQRRGLATGIVFAGAGVGGVTFPLVINGLLTSVGFGWTLRFFSLFFLIVPGAATYFARPRVQIRAPARDPSEPRLLTREGFKGVWREFLSLLPSRKDFAFIVDKTWITVATIQFIQSISWFAVSLYIVDYSVSVGASSSLSTGILSTFNAATILAQTGTGWLVDRMPFPIVMFISCILASAMSYLLLGFATTLPLVLTFVVFFGSVAGGFFTTSARVSSELARDRNVQASIVVYSLMFVRGLASIAGPLIAASLYRTDLVSEKASYGAYGFQPIVLFVGSGMAASSILAACFQYFRTKVQS